MGVVRFALEADEAKAVRAWLKLTDAERKAEVQAAKVSRATKRVGTDARRAGADGAKAFMSMAAGAISFTAAVAAARHMLGLFDRDRRQAASWAKEEAAFVGPLAQLAGGDPAEMTRMRKAVEASRTGHGLSGQAAAKLQFALESAGEAKNREIFAGLKYIVEDPSTLVEGVTKVKKSFGVDETGNSRAVLNKMLKASGISLTKLEAFGPLAAGAAQAFAKLGSSDEELMGTLAVATQAVGQSSEAKTQLSALAQVITKKGMGGEGFIKGLAKLERAVGQLKDEEQLSYFGREEAARGFGVVQKNLPAIKKAIADVDAAGRRTGPGDLLSSTTGPVFEASPSLVAAKAVSIAHQELKIAQQSGAAVQAMRREESLITTAAKSWGRGESPAMRYAAAVNPVAAAFFGADAATVHSLGLRARGHRADPIVDVIMGVPAAIYEGVAIDERRQSYDYRRSRGWRPRPVPGVDNPPGVGNAPPPGVTEGINAAASGQTVINNQNHYGDVFAEELRPERLPPDAATVEVP